jgi:integrase
MPVKQLSSKNPNHPKLGCSIKVEPLRSKSEIDSIKSILTNNPRDYCLFTLGINTAFRANELVSITVGQVKRLKAFDTLTVKQSKTNKYRTVTINKVAYEAIQSCLYSHPSPNEDTSPLFCSTTTGRALKPSTLSKYMKQWCRLAGLEGQYASHTIRKTWGYQIYRHHNHTSDQKQGSRKIAELMLAFGHKTERQTLEYLCISDSEIQSLYRLEL